MEDREPLLEIPTDERTEALEKDRWAQMADIAFRQAALADRRAKEDTEKGEDRGANWESRLCLRWMREWRKLTRERA